METKKNHIVYFFRKPFTDYFSIEELFGFIQSALPYDIHSTNYSEIFYHTSSVLLVVAPVYLFFQIQIS